MSNVFEKSKKVLYYGAYWRRLKVAMKKMAVSIAALGGRCAV
jgi:hypothetical protein